MRHAPRRARRLLAPVVLALRMLAGCTTVESISISQIPEKSLRTDAIKARGWSPVILLIPFGSSYVDNARADLLSQCPEGAIEGMLAKFEEVNYFLGLYATQNVTLQGYCVRTTSKPATGKHGRRPKRSGV